MSKKTTIAAVLSALAIGMTGMPGFAAAQSVSEPDDDGMTGPCTPLPDPPGNCIKETRSRPDMNREPRSHADRDREAQEWDGSAFLTVDAEAPEFDVECDLYLVPVAGVGVLYWPVCLVEVD